MKFHLKLIANFSNLCNDIWIINKEAFESRKIFIIFSAFYNGITNPFFFVLLLNFNHNLSILLSLLFYLPLFMPTYIISISGFISQWIIISICFFSLPWIKSYYGPLKYFCSPLSGFSYSFWNQSRRR